MKKEQQKCPHCTRDLQIMPVCKGCLTQVDPGWGIIVLIAGFSILVGFALSAMAIVSVIQ